MQGETMGTVLDHVLIVDPNDTVRTEVRRLLSQVRVVPSRVTEASTVDDALQAYNAPYDQRPQVVIFALELLGERGDEWLTAVRNGNQAFNTPIVLLGENEEDERIEVALAAGAYDWLLLTGLNSRRLFRTLENVFARHHRFLQTLESETHFRTLVDSTPSLLWLSDATKQRTFFNKVWLDFTGRTVEQETGFGWLEGLHPDDRERIFNQYSQTFDRREPLEMEYRLRRYDGQYRWIMAQGQARYSPDGLFLGYTGSCTDITERKQAEEELRLNEERLRVVLNGSTITVMTVDRNLRYTWLHNPQSGYAAAQVLGKRDDEIFPAEIAKPFIEFKQAVLDSKTSIHRELELPHDGLLERFDTRGEPLLDAEGNIVGVTVVTINITERVRNEERANFLAEASQLLSASLDYGTTLQQVANAMVPKLADWCSVEVLTEERIIDQVAVAHVDPAKVKWAKSWRELHPPSIDDPRGLAYVLRTGETEFYPEISQDLIEEALRNAESEEQRLAIQSINFRSVIIVPLVTRNKILGAITLVWSDSDRRYNEADLEFVQELARRAATAVDHARLYRESQLRAEELHVLNETLESLVGERTKELQRSNQDLDQFAYIASHDLKAPLRAIDHLSTWVLEDAGHLLPPRSQEHLGKMRSRIKRMEGLLDDLLTYSRAGRYRGEASSVDTNELVTRVIDTVAPPENFTVTVEGDLPTIHTYPAPLETVLRNLVNNAIKHHNKEQGHIWISATTQEEMVEFAVRDDGPGIDPAFHDRIFQMFQTLRPRDQVEGSGIGLAVVEKIVASVGGKISVESAPGQGATFRFTWPLELVE